MALSKYKPEFVRMVSIHLSEGWSLASFSGVIKVNETTIASWLKKHPEFKQAVDENRKQDDIFKPKKPQKVCLNENRINSNH